MSQGDISDEECNYEDAATIIWVIRGGRVAWIVRSCTSRDGGKDRVKLNRGIYQVVGWPL